MKRVHTSLAVLASAMLSPYCGGQDVAGPSAFDGIWRSEGYGYVAEIGSAKLTLYEVTSLSLVEIAEGALRGDNVTLRVPAIDFTIPMTLSPSGDALSVNVGYPFLKSIKFTAIPSLPALTASTNNPETNFEVFWQAFEEQYAFWALRNVDWHAQYQTYRPQVSAATTGGQLFDIFSAMIRPLEDGHVSLSDGIRGVSAYVPHPLQHRFADFQRIITESYLHRNVTCLANGLLCYGSLTPAIGYLSIFAMEGFANSDEFDVQRTALTTALDQIIETFKDLTAVVIDVRFSEGGLDTFALLIAGRFADQRRTAYSKQARRGGYEDFTDLQEVFIQPVGPRQFTRKVALLTSRATISAAEAFVMSLMPFAYVTRIGEPTAGAFSDILPRFLPNGWMLTLSNERYWSHDMINYEKVGITPHIELFLSEADLAAGTDGILDEALRMLQQPSATSPSARLPRGRPAAAAARSPARSDRGRT